LGVFLPRLAPVALRRAGAFFTSTGVDDMLDD
jgi:hypothetical protein